MVTKKDEEKKLTFRQEASEVFASNYRQNEPLIEYVANGLGGVADHLIICTDASELIVALKLSLKHHIPYRVIGGGYGSLFSDVGFPGLIIINQAKQMFFLPEVGQVLVESGLSNDEIINTASLRGMGGLEFLSVVPGTIGGAVASQVTFQASRIDQFVRELSVFLPDKDGGQVVRTSLAEYRNPELLFHLYRLSDYPPVIINIRLQFVHLSNEEVLARIVRMRKQRPKHNDGNNLGYIFNQDLHAILLTLPNYRKLKFETLLFSKSNFNIIKIRPRVKAAQVRRDLEILEAFLKENGHDLAFRLSFVGYWPSEEENSPTGTAINTESI